MHVGEPSASARERQGARSSNCSVTRGQLELIFLGWSEVRLLETETSQSQLLRRRCLLY